MDKLVIEWKHFDKEGKTCERCSKTGNNLNQVIEDIKKECLLKGIDIQFKETKLPESRMSESNQILINETLIENLIPNTKAGENSCDSCSDLIDDLKRCSCRTIKQGDNIHEEIPVSLIKQAITNSLNKEKKTMKIQVLGSGCPTCKKLHEITQKAVDELGLKTKVEYITDVSKIIEMGVMQSPVLAVNGNPVITGFTPDIEKIKKVINAGMKIKKDSSKCSCGGGCC